MKTLYLDCSMGAAGDMLSAALSELDGDRDSFIKEVNSIGLDNVRITYRAETKCGIAGTRMIVKVDGVQEGDTKHLHHSHSHRTLADIEHIVSGLRLSQKVREDVSAIYKIIADAESEAHGTRVSEIHFHEVGSLDAIADIAMTALLIERLAPQKIIASPIHVGSGQVHCAHGIMPVPAPATANILRTVPIYGGKIEGELCTPTGAAILKYYVSSFGEMPVMRVEKTGYGMGKKDFEVANCVRAFWGETQAPEDEITELCCNVDDMTAEETGYAMQAFFKAGALDVYTVPIGMKKSRPGTLICVMCKTDEKDRFVYLMFKHTTTIGIRENKYGRFVLQRHTETVETKFGPVRKKISEGYGVLREKLEFDDLSRIAEKSGMSISEVIKKLSADG